MLDFLWMEVPAWTLPPAFLLTIGLVRLWYRIVDRSAVPPEDTEALRRTIEIQRMAISAHQSLHEAQKIVFAKMAEDYSFLAVARESDHPRRALGDEPSPDLTGKGRS